MFDRIDAFVREVGEAETEAALAGLLAEISREMGFAYFALTHHVDVRRAPGPAIRLANYPAGWVDYFDGNGLGPSDPVHRASQLTSVGFAWSRLPRLIDLTPRASATASRSPRTCRAKPTVRARSPRRGGPP